MFKPYKQIRSVTFALIAAIVPLLAPVSRAADFELFARTNLAAWCIVPFDAKKRGPTERAEMVAKLGFKHIAYDWRAEHVAQFETEILEYKKRGLGYFAFWSTHEEAFKLFEKHGLRPQIWVTAPSPAGANQTERVEKAAAQLLSVVERTRKAGCQLGLYNHGGWGGEPENMIAIAKLLREKHGAAHVGIIYNQHHGHDHVDRFATALAAMKPYLLCLNLNGMTRDGEKRGQKILPLGSGELDLPLLKIIRDSGYRGPIGIIGHTNDDVEERLRDNLDGLDWLLPQLEGKPAGPKPKFRTQKTAPAAQQKNAPDTGMVVDGKPEYRERPITIECRAKLNSARGFNIIIASDTKASAEHWELYSYAGSGEFSVYQPGRGGEFKSTTNICDGQWHHLAAVLEPERVRLYVDGKLVLNKPAAALKGTPRPGGLAFGRLVEGGIACDGALDSARLSKGVREPAGDFSVPMKNDAQTIGFWNLKELLPRSATGSPSPNGDLWAVEDPKEREKLPLYQTIPAAKTFELTPANGLPKREALLEWTRSHGGDGSERYSALEQISRANVKQLEVAWTYHSGDGKANLQCNPIVVDGVMFAPTAGDYLAAINAATGVELWRFKPEGKPAFRGLTWWPGADGVAARLFFPTEKNWLYALDPKTGKPAVGFGETGRVKLAQGARVAPAIFERTLVIAGYLKDVEAFDVVTGARRWEFHTVPQAGEFGAETWSKPQSNAANCWGGMALDAARGIVFIATGSPKPNFLGMLHRGDNLFANCVVALDARTGRRLWHFQEIRHDIWDLDIPAPPLLTTITRDGKKVDVVAAVSKIGNTILLDRVSGKPVFPFRLRRAPVSTVPGELTAPYQPDVELPQPFARQDYTPADAPDRDPEVRDLALSQLKSLQFGWFQPVSHRKMTVFYNVHGGAEWTGACADPTSGRLYVTSNQVPWLMSLIANDEPSEDLKSPPTAGRKVYEQTCLQCHGTDRNGVGVAPALRGLRQRLKDSDVLALLKSGRGLMPVAPPMNADDEKALLDYLFLRDRTTPAPTGRPERPSFGQSGWNRFLDTEGYPACKPPWGTLNCIDLNTGKLLWQVPLGEYDELTKRGVPKTGTENFGGAIVTAGGLVFASGTRDGKIRAFDTDTGAELWSAKLPLNGTAPPTTYAVNGRQFIVIPATGGGKLGGPAGDAYVAFALPKK